MNNEDTSRPLSRGTKIAILASILAIVGGAVVAGCVVGGRPKAPPPSDPNAGLAAAEFCVNAINQAIVDKAVEISQPEPGRKFVRYIQYTNGAVRVLYDVQPGQNVENAEYSVAVFITSLFGESNSPVWKLFGETSTPWLRCTQALQYFEQEKAKDVARDLQNWVFGPPAPEPSLEGKWTLTRTLTACENLVEGCSTTPIDIRFESCTDTQCIMSRDTVWRGSHSVMRTGPGTWTAQFDDIAIFCNKDNRRTYNPGSYTMSFTVNDAADQLTGTYTYTAATNPPCSETGLRGSYDVAGKRS